MGYQILIGDVIDRLRELPSESVHCVVTSPPYWGLRDYGTASWEGGDIDCDHKQEVPRFNGPKQTNAQVSGHASKAEVNGRKVCQKCGATSTDQQIGLEATPAEFLAKMTAVFREVRRVLRSDGTCWVNMGDSYANDGKWGGSTGGKHVTALHGDSGVGRGKTVTGLKPKDLVGMPWRLAFALQDDGWWLRQDIIWSKPNPMPESVTDRCTKAHEYLFLLTKSGKYFYDAESIKEPANGWNGSEFHDGKNAIIHPNVGMNNRGKGNAKTFRGGVYTQSNAFENSLAMERDSQGNAPNITGKRNKRSVWEIATEAFPEAHFATFPTKLVEPCILAGTSEKGCCAKCGAPWWRKTERVDTGRTQKMADGWDTGEGGHGTVHRDGREAGEAGIAITVAATVGWLPACLCEAAIDPCTVLDPFNGSGTTGLVALANRCEYIGIELNPEYAAMSERRLKEASAQEVLEFA